MLSVNTGFPNVYTIKNNVSMNNFNINVWVFAIPLSLPIPWYCQTHNLGKVK